MSFLLIHIGYSAAVWLNDRNPLITPMGHQTFSTEQVTSMVRFGSDCQDSPRSVKGDRILGDPHPLSPLRLSCQKTGRYPGCQNPVSNHQRTR